MTLYSVTRPRKSDCPYSSDGVSRNCVASNGPLVEMCMQRVRYTSLGLAVDLERPQMHETLPASFTPQHWVYSKER